MAETVSDKDVEKARQRVDRLNEQIAAANAEASANVRSQENAVRKARLDAEAERLEQHLAALKAQTKKSTVNAVVKDAVAEVSEGQASAAPAPAGGTIEEK